ncbi:hypothetical protein FJTKL_07645 [Diaporthe vaccinii]|uniref:Uncharacterized protein n=1 Tax=Diaporthe vaccinii TaxID=105482 RepID=A0ABR4ET52_9PEZI
MEAAVAHAFNGDKPGPIAGIASLNYTLSDFPTCRRCHVLRGLALLKALGLTDGSYILTGHSAGACLSFQAIYQAPRYWRLASPSDDDENNVDPEEEPPTPAAHVAMNGLYDLPMTQTEKLEVRLREVDGLQVQRGHRCTGRHAAPWEEGIMIWENLLDVLKALE